MSDRSQDGVLNRFYLIFSNGRMRGNEKGFRSKNHPTFRDKWNGSVVLISQMCYFKFYTCNNCEMSKII